MIYLHSHWIELNSVGIAKLDTVHSTQYIYIHQWNLLDQIYQEALLTANYEFLFNFCADIISNPYHPGACNFEDTKVKDGDFTEYVRSKNTSAMASS